MKLLDPGTKFNLLSLQRVLHNSFRNVPGLLDPSLKSLDAPLGTKVKRGPAVVLNGALVAVLSLCEAQDANFYFFNPMWKIRKYQVQGTQRFCADVDQIVKVSTRQIIALRRSRALRGP